MTDADWTVDDTTADYLARFQQAWADVSPESVRRAFYKALALPEGRLENVGADRNARRQLALDGVDEVLADIEALIDGL
jgi:hypothetical protein